MADPTTTENRLEPERPPVVASVPPTAPSTLTGGRIALIIGGSLLALLALAVLLLGAYGLWLDTTQRSDGYVMTSDERFSTSGYALSTQTLEVSSDVPGFLYGGDWLGDVRIRGESADPARPVFIGIARKNDVDRYLAGVARSEVVDVSGRPFGTSYEPTYRVRPGGSPSVPPERADFWVASAAGSGTQAVSWSVESGRWAVVVMRPDGSRGVSADLAAGAELPALLWVSIVGLGIGVLLGAGAGMLIYLGARDRSRPTPT